MSLREYLDEVRRRAEAAPRGPWRYEWIPGGDWGFANAAVVWTPEQNPDVDDPLVEIRSGILDCFQRADNHAAIARGKSAGQFIAAARTDIPRLLAIVDTLAAAVRAGCPTLPYLHLHPETAAIVERAQRLIDQGTDALGVDHHVR